MDNDTTLRGATDPPRLAFGPYAGERVDRVAVMDPGYLRDLVREGVGSAELRAEAARALLRRDRLDEAGGDRPAGAGQRRAWLGSPAAWKTVLVAGVVVAAVAAVWVGRGGPGRAGGEDTRGGVEAVGTAAPGSAAGSVAVGTTRPPESTRRPESTSLPGSTDASGSTADGASAPCGARVAGAIPAEAAGDFLDTFQAVEFEVVKTRDTGRVTFLNSHDPYQGHFYVAIFPTDYERYPGPPVQYFRGKCIVVQGTIELYRGAPQMVLRGPEDVRIVDESATAAP
jgi:hypothetical protein